MNLPSFPAVYQSRAAPVDASNDGQHPAPLTVYSHSRLSPMNRSPERSVARQKVG